MRKHWLLFLLLGTVCACGGQKESLPEVGQQLATEVSIFETKDNQKQWVLTAESVDFEDMQNATLKNPKLLLRKDAKDIAQVTGDSGTFDYAQKLVTIEGHAKIAALQGKTHLTTQHFFYDIDKDRIWSDTKTVGVWQNAKMTASGGIETDSKLSKIEVKKQKTRLPSKIQGVKTK